MPQAKSSPTVSAVSDPRAGTNLGRGNPTKLPMPSWPWALFPQYYKLLFVSIVHVELVPAAICPGAATARLMSSNRHTRTGNASDTHVLMRILIAIMTSSRSL